MFPEKKDSLLWAVLFVSTYILSFFPFNLYLLAPVAFLFLFVYINNTTKHVFLKTTLLFYPFYAFHTFWILHLQVEKGVEKFLVLGLLLLPLYLSLYPGLFSLFSRQIMVKKYPVFYKILCVPSLWVILEYIKSTGAFGFPWMNLYYSQLNHYFIASLASITGPYGLSFIIVLLGYLFFIIYKSRSRLLFSFTLLLVLILELSGYLVYKKLKNLKTDSALKVAILQPNILPRNIYDPQEWSKTRDSVLYLVRKIKKNSVDIIVLSESAIPGYFRYSIRAMRLLKDIHDSTGALILFGTQDKRRVKETYRTFNTVMLFDGTHILDLSDKHHLVPFGEWLPYQYKLPGKLKKFNLGWGDFFPGSIKTINISGHKAGILICFESIFPEISRELTKKGAEMLFVLTNDGWFGISKGPIEHFEMSRLRSIETGRYIVRSAKTGISAVIEPTGRVIKKLGLFKKGIIIYNVPFIKEKTFYTVHGEFMVYLSFLIVLAFLVYNKLYTLKERRHG